ncbi:YheU family protein [Geobacter argillaceus]|uniref:YheU family protein n=1 Tax=Geobacter argillaceus TaxID=345631 RepID=A0A562VNM5_9BACT|nr:YheU family protein [Geobacter argillaceus]TWJ19337.1 hypothetical protein JN12_01750 [Geobacter argillaceus]
MPQQVENDHREEGVEIPLDRLQPDTLRNIVSEFVTREWEEVGETSYTLDEKIEQVLRQLQEKKAKVVFDATSNSCNIVQQ